MCFNTLGEIREEDPITTATRTIVSGNPVFVENGGNVSAYVGNNKVGVRLFNEKHFSTTKVWKDAEIKLLILGHLHLTADTLVTYFNSAQDFMPLLYLYAPPLGMGTSTVSMDMAVEISKSAVASTDVEGGERLLPSGTILGLMYHSGDFPGSSKSVADAIL